MRHVRSIFLVLFVTLFSTAVQAAEVRLIKVLPQYLDKKGMHTLSPSLYERDAYQKELRDHPERRSAVRFAVQHSTPKKGSDLKVRVELRGVKGQELTTVTREINAARDGMFRSWTMLELGGADYKAFGEMSAWRVTLLKNGKPIAEHKSFLW